MFPTVNHSHLRALQVRGETGSHRASACVPTYLRAARGGIVSHVKCTHTHTSARPCLQPLVEAAARRHGVPYCRSNTIADAFVKLWQHLAEMGAKPAKAKAA